MLDIMCEKCGGNLFIDDGATIKEYLKDGDYRIDDVGKIVEESVQQYLVYKCSVCNTIYKFTYKDWERLHRKAIAEYVMEIRKQHMFKTEINPYSINADNGLSFCGQCSGYAGDGNCLNDVIRQCTIRKNDV